MRSLFFTLILGFVFYGVTHAQDVSECPKISVTQSSEFENLEKPITFTASINEEPAQFKIEYEWKVISGKIVDGQGTSASKVIPKDNLGVTVMVIVKGVPEGCPNAASGAYTPKFPADIDYDSFPKFLPPRIDKPGLDMLGTALRRYSEYNGFIFYKFKKGTSQNVIRRTFSNTLNFLGREPKINRKRITFGINKADENSMATQIVSVGNSVFVCDECVVLDESNFEKTLNKLFPTTRKKATRNNAKRY
jgi:hypothetical protein